MSREEYIFTAPELAEARRTWGCNCGPAALAHFARCRLEEARDAIPGFADKRYTSPSMMQAGLVNLAMPWNDVGASASLFIMHRPALVRVQFTGPWTQPGANPKWAYRHTHWIVTWRDDERGPMVFDVNCLVAPYEGWRRDVVPELIKSIPRADGWQPTHVWRLDATPAGPASEATSKGGA